MAIQIKQNPQSYDIFTFIFCLGQIVGAFPLKFVESDENCTITFRWKNYKVVYSVIHIILLFGMVFFSVYGAQRAEIAWTFRQIVRIMFYVSCTWGAIVFLWVSTKWSNLFDKWISVDKKMEYNYGFPKNLYKRTKLMALITFICCLCEVFIYILYNLEDARKLAIFQGKAFGHSAYFKTLFAYVFRVLPYSIILGITCQFIHSFCIWRMAYTDLFISIISSLLSIRFRQITDRIQLAAKKKRTIDFWREIREDYNRLCVLCKEVDDAITNIIFLSYSINLLFLLTYLRSCTIIEEMTLEKIYTIVSFFVYLVRIFLVSLYVSWVNDASKEPRTFLNSVSTTQYNTEIQRLLQQINANTVVFTGNKMFKVTRTLILSIGGIILTYELVLVQFSELRFKQS